MKITEGVYEAALGSWNALVTQQKAFRAAFAERETTNAGWIEFGSDGLVVNCFGKSFAGKSTSIWADSGRFVLEYAFYARGQEDGSAPFAVFYLKEDGEVSAEPGRTSRLICKFPELHQRECIAEHVGYRALEGNVFSAPEI